MYMRVLAVICFITTCTSIDLPQPDQVTHAAAYQYFDHKRGLWLYIASTYNWNID